MTSDGEPVKLYVYDLSRGMAKQLSLSMTGKQIDGIWHTSVVVYGQEFYYGQGILTAIPGTTHHGQPLEMIDMGSTFLPQEVLIEYLESQHNVYTPEKYHLLDFNCNTFSNDLCQFLTGQTVPNHIINLPAEFINTPFGQTLRPMIEGMFGQSSLQGSSTASAPAAPSANAVQALQSVSSAAVSTSQSVQTAQNLSSLETWIQSHTAVMVFFTSATCPPCQTIKPEFYKLIEERNSGRLQLLGVIVDTSMAFDVSTKYNVRATPTFMSFHNGQKISEFRGANVVELKSSIDLLVFTAYPPHPHRKIMLRAIPNQSTQPILFYQVNDIDAVLRKLRSFVEETKDGWVSDYDALLAQVKDMITGQTTTINMVAWRDMAEDLMTRLPLDKQFPFIDLFRLLLKHKQLADFYSSSQIARMFEQATQPNMKGTTLMTLRVACNLFTHQTLATSYFTSHLARVSRRASFTALVVSCLLSTDTQTRQTAASLAFNCTQVVTIERQRIEAGEPVGMAEQEDDDWHVEIASAVTDALEKETDQDIVHRLLAALANLLFLAPAESTVAHVLAALEVPRLINSKLDSLDQTKVRDLARDVTRLIQASAEDQDVN